MTPESEYTSCTELATSIDMVNVGGGVNGGGYLNRLRKENNGQGRQYRSGQAGTPADNKFARDHLRETAHRRRQPITLNAMFAGLDIGDAGADDSVPSYSLGGQRKYKNGRHCEDGCCPGKPEESKPEPKPFRSADVLGRGRLTAKPSAELGTRFATLGDLGTVAVDTTAKDSHFRKFPNRNYQPGPRYAWLDQSAREFSPTPQRKGSSWDEREAPASPASVIDDADAIVQDEPAEVVIIGGGPHALAALSALSADHSLVKSDGSERTAFSMTGKEGSPQGGNKGMRTAA